MHMKAQYEKKMQAQLDELKSEFEKLKTKAVHTEANLQFEYDTKIDELSLKLEAAEQKYQLFRQVHDDDWEKFKTELEHSWDSLREMIRAITSP